MYWKHNVTVPPYVTHNKFNGNGNRHCHHLYGKMTREGRFIFGGDRYVHPVMHPRTSHPLPRVIDKLHKGPYNHASTVFPSLQDMNIVSKWGGIMPFSADGEPIVGELHTSNADKHMTNSKKGLYVISGLGGSGMMKGAMAGYLLAQIIVDTAENEPV